MMLKNVSTSAHKARGIITAGEAGNPVIARSIARDRGTISNSSNSDNNRKRLNAGIQKCSLGTFMWFLSILC